MKKVFPLKQQNDVTFHDVKHLSPTKMKATFIGLLWIFTDILLQCRGHPRNFNHSDMYGNYSEKAMKRLLQLFGLEDSMYQRENNPFLPPQYMLDLYKFYSDDSTNRKPRYSAANTVRSFYDKAESNNGEYFFDLFNSISADEEIVDAEFHFFTSRSYLHPHNSSHLIQIQLFEGDIPSDSKLLQARLVSAYSSGWEVFKVTSSVTKWVSNPIVNLGLTVKVLNTDGQEWLSQQVHRLQNYRRPILVVFSKAPKTKSTQSTEDSRSPKKTTSDKNITHLENTTKNSRNARSTSLHEHGLCTRHELRVDFDRLGWSAWIISPKWYDAYLCAGTCAFPLGQNQRPTNHATVQSIVHELGLAKGVRAPCCVPTELRPVSLLYFDEYNNVVLKQYDDMIATGCGCH